MDSHEHRLKRLKFRAGHRGFVEADLILGSFAERHAASLTPAQLALLWVKDQPGVTAPIFGPRTLAQLDEALPVLDMRLDDELRAACDALVPAGSAVANFHNSAAWMKMRVE